MPFRQVDDAEKQEYSNERSDRTTTQQVRSHFRQCHCNAFYRYYCCLATAYLLVLGHFGTNTTMVRRQDFRAATSVAVATLMRLSRVLEQMLNASIKVGTCVAALRAAAIHRKSLGRSLGRSLRRMLDTRAESQQPLAIVVTSRSRCQAYRQTFVAKAIALSALFMRSLKPARWDPLGYHRALLLNGALLHAFLPEGSGA